MLRDSQEEIYLQRLLSFFATTSRALDCPSDLSMSCEEFLRKSAQVAVRDLCDWCRIDLRTDLNLGKGVSAHAQSHLEPVLDQLQKMESGDPDGLLNPLRVIRSGFAVFCEEVSKEALDASVSCHIGRNIFERLGVQSYICVPIRRGSETIGSLTLIRSPEAKAFDSMDLLIAEEFATKISVNLERALLYKNLAELKDAAEAANKAKTNFLANVSHEIRTPLGAVLGFADLLISTSPPLRDRLDWGNRIRNNGVHLLRLIDDILDLSKVEVGRLDIKLEKIDFRNLLHDVYAFAKEKARGKNLTIDFSIETNLPRYILTDETRLSQILCNVLGNAIKFTPSGFVRMKIGKIPSSENKIYFDVTDSGIGIAKDQASILFQPFSQADNSRTRQFGGTGLGLALSRGLARHLGGDLILKESDLNQGSTFSITIDGGLLPSEEFATMGSSERASLLEMPSEDLSRALRGRKILVVEDSTDIQALLKRMLEGAGATISLAGNGEEGLQAALAESYDVVLMDVQMPIKDGCQTVKELRAFGYKGLVVALTANAMLDEQKRCLEAGFDIHLSKPMRRMELIQNLRQLTSSQLH